VAGRSGRLDCLDLGLGLSRPQSWGSEISKPSASRSRMPVGSRIRGRFIFCAWLATASLGVLTLTGCRNRYFVMPTTAMEPTIKRGTRFAMVALEPVDRAKLSRGEIVVFRLPGGASNLQVRRIVAIGGDWVEIRSKHLLVNGKEVSESYLTHTDPITYEGAATSANLSRDQMPVTQVPAGKVFLLGDNRDNSHDSRFFGAIKTEDVIGRVNATH
jgi:signal peptidase I